MTKLALIAVLALLVVFARSSQSLEGVYQPFTKQQLESFDEPVHGSHHKKNKDGSTVILIAEQSVKHASRPAYLDSQSPAMPADQQTQQSAEERAEQRKESNRKFNQIFKIGLYVSLVAVAIILVKLFAVKRNVRGTVNGNQMQQQQVLNHFYGTNTAPQQQPARVAMQMPVHHANQQYAQAQVYNCHQNRPVQPHQVAGPVAMMSPYPVQAEQIRGRTHDSLINQSQPRNNALEECIAYHERELIRLKEHQRKVAEEERRKQYTPLPNGRVLSDERVVYRGNIPVGQPLINQNQNQNQNQNDANSSFASEYPEL